MFNNKQKKVICIVLAICMIVPVAIASVSMLFMR